MTIDIQDLEVRYGIKCPYCGEKSEKTTTEAIYGPGKNYGDIFICRPCDAYVGIHKDGPNKGMGKGYLGNEEVRRARQKAHLYFDPLWLRKKRKFKLSNKKARLPAYQWLSIELGILEKDCHISLLTIEQCEKVVEVCKPFIWTKNKMK